MRMLVVALVSAAALATGCLDLDSGLVVTGPQSLAVGSAQHVGVGSVRPRSGAALEAPRVTDAYCDDGACETMIDERGLLTIRALVPGESRLHITAEDYGRTREADVPVRFHVPDRLEVEAWSTVALPPGVAQLVGGEVRCAVEARATGLRDPLVLSADAVRHAVQGDAFDVVRGPEVAPAPGQGSSSVVLRAARPGTTRLSFTAAGLTREITLRAVGEDEVVAIALHPLGVVKTAFEAGGPLGVAPSLAERLLEDESLVPVLELADGGIALGGAARVTFEPEELVEVQASDGRVRLVARAVGEGVLRVRVGAVEIAIPRRTSPPSWKR